MLENWQALYGIYFTVANYNPLRTPEQKPTDSDCEKNYAPPGDVYGLQDVGSLPTWTMDVGPDSAKKTLNMALTGVTRMNRHKALMYDEVTAPIAAPTLAQPKVRPTITP